ncbi:hypothetical protein FRC08_011399 [Ceratobasidium sp. 394]|nr:hypothetical protein FRC08_011399 [Ceratobasidium sp. 394]KAG9088450.1 hypothetical protein FS749_002163 [Ceratobasidium sp. UAMH 11750]
MPDTTHVRPMDDDWLNDRQGNVTCVTDPRQDAADSQGDAVEDLEVDDALVEQFDEWQNIIERVADGTGNDVDSEAGL